MCELLGMSFSRPTDPTLSFRGFQHRSERNREGWGVACYPDGAGAAMVVKEPVKAKVSALASFVREGGLPPSSVHVIHVRNGGAGAAKAYRNTHPFLRTIGNRDYVFAHNGTLCMVPAEAGTPMFEPIGETDSEQAFCRLLTSHEASLRNRAWRKVHGWLIEANKAGTLNCLLSDGETLLAYRDKNGERELHQVERKSPFSSVKLADEDYEIDLGEVKSPDDYGCIFATRPLTIGETWIPLKPGELVVARLGQIQSRLNG